MYRRLYLCLCLGYRRHNRHYADGQIWTSRDNFIFKRPEPDLYKSTRIFKTEMASCFFTGQQGYCGMKAWVQNFV
jgi:hypothetical protein